MSATLAIFAIACAVIGAGLTLWVAWRNLVIFLAHRREVRHG